VDQAPAAALAAFWPRPRGRRVGARVSEQLLVGKAWFAQAAVASTQHPIHRPPRERCWLTSGSCGALFTDRAQNAGRGVVHGFARAIRRAPGSGASTIQGAAEGGRLRWPPLRVYPPFALQSLIAVRESRGCRPSQAAFRANDSPAPGRVWMRVTQVVGQGRR